VTRRKPSRLTTGRLQLLRLFSTLLAITLILRLRQNASDVNRIETSRNLSVKAWLRHLVRITHGGLTTGSLRSNKQRGRDKAEQAATLFTLHLALCQTSHLIQRSSLRFYPEEKASKKGKRRRPGSTSICARGFLLRPFCRQVRRLYARTIGTERRRVTLCSCS
jgi:hypothetical protein